MLIHLVNAAVIFPDRVEQGYVTVKEGRIMAAGPGEPEVCEKDQVWNLRGRYLSPGFVEIHSHGAGGCDFMDGTAEAVVTAAKTHMHHGTTTLYPTTLAASREEILGSIDALRSARRIITDGPELPGLHMEGPYLNPEQKGAIDEQYIRNPKREEYEEFIFYGEGAISRWTLAPELPGAGTFAGVLREHGIVPSMGHSAAEYSQVLEAYHSGISHVTHLYSAMSGMVRRGGFRYPGLVESAYCINDLTVEVIADGCHLPVEILQMVYRIKGPDKVVLTCDSMRCAGQDVKESVLGSLRNGRRVIIEDDVAKLPDRSAFAGSIATDDRLVRVMYHRAGVPLWDCIRMMCLTPARIMGQEGQIGSIMPGKRANLVCFDEDIQVEGVMVHGKVVYGNFGEARAAAGIW